MKAPYDYSIAPLQPYLDHEGVSDICINRPNEVFLDYVGEKGFKRIEDKNITQNVLTELARDVAALAGQSINTQSPVLGGTLPTGQRIHFITPPACMNGQFVMVIRKQVIHDIDVDFLIDDGFFSKIIDKHNTPDLGKVQHFAILIELLKNGQIKTFFEKAIEYKMNIVFSGTTGSGKTTILNAILKFLHPEERLVILEEDALEVVTHNTNNVRLIYSDKEDFSVDVDALLKATLRIRPDRIMMSEIRGAEAFTYLNSLMTGHAGGLTTIHANDVRGVFERIVFMLLKSRNGFTTETAKLFSENVVDIVVQIGRDGGLRSCDDIWVKGMPHD